MFDKVGSRPNIPSVVGVMSQLVDVLFKDNVLDKLELGSISIHLLT